MAKKKKQSDVVAKTTEHYLKRNVAKNRLDWHMGFVPEQAGWIPEVDRTVEVQKTHEQFLFDVPHVAEIFTSGNDSKKRPRIWELVARAVKQNIVPQEVLRKGQFKNISQIIGSCVGFGMGNALLWASLIDAIVRGQWERVLVPFVPYHYGRGRKHSGIRGPGSGSLGSGQAEAVKLDGYLAFDPPGLPDCNFGDSIYWSEAIEYQWSDGDRIEDKWIQEGRKNLVPTVARVTNTEEAAQLADNYYVFTIASDFGGRMRCPVVDGVLLNEKVTRWNHQMSVLDYIIHPRLGRLWYIFNQWKYPHGKDPGGPWDNNTGAPEGGFYVQDKWLQYILGQRDSFAYADPDGVIDRNRKLDFLMG